MDFSQGLANDTDKSKEELVAELEELRARVAGLKAGKDWPGQAGSDPGADRTALGLIAGNIDEVIFLFSPDWREAFYVSPAYEHIWGRPVRDVYRNPGSWMDAIVSEDIGAVTAFVTGQARGEVAYENSIDYRITKPDGTIRWINGRTYPVKDERGAVCQITGIAGDITGRKLAEERLKENERFLNNIFNCFQDGISILDRDLNIITVNPVMKEWYRSAMPLEGKKCYRAYHCRDMPCEVCPSLRAMEQKTAQTETHPRLGKDGKPERWLEISAFPIIDDAGAVTGVVEHVRDITDRKRAEDALRESEEKYRSLVENINDMVWETDRDHRITYVSAQIKDILGYEPEEAIGRTPFDFFLPEDWDRLQPRALEMYDKRAPMALLEHRAVRKDGGIVYLESNGMPIFGDDGRFRGYRGINRDVTGRKRTEMRLKLTQFSIDRAADMAVWLNRDGTLFYVNEEYCKATGYGRDELIGRKVFDVNPNFDASNWAEHWEETKRRGSMAFESTIRRKDGSVFPAEISVNFLVYEGQEMHCTFVRDMTERKKAEEWMRLMQHVIDQTQDEASLADPEGRFVYVNDSKCRSLGYTREELLSMSVWDVDPDISPDAWPAVWRNLKAQGSIKTEASHRGKDGRTFPSEIWTTYLHFQDREYACAFVRDITDRKRVEESLKLTQFTMDRAGDMVLWVAPDSRYTYVNQAACQTFGYTRDEMMAMTTFDTCPSWTEVSWAEHWKEIKEKGSFTIERPLRKKDGSYFPGEISVNYIDYEGREYNCSFIRDITERKRTEEALRESEQKFRKLANLTKAGIVLYRDRKFIYTNPMLEKNTGYTKDELTSMDFWDIVHPDHREMVRGRGMARQRGKDVPSTYEFKILTKGGETKWVEMSAMHIEYEGKPTILCTLYDITDRKRSEEELHEAKAQAELYLDLMGHDINNLNQIGIGFLEIALDTIRMSPEEKELIARPLEALEASTRLIGNVRKLQKMREGGFKFHDIDVGKCIRSVLPRYSDVPGREIRINHTATCDCIVRANDLLDDVFSNLIGNAIKHSTGRLDIDIFVSKAKAGDREYCLTAIEDNGPGISDALKDRLFSRSGHGEAKGNRKGMGLYLVRTLVEGFDGKVWVEDRVRGHHTEGARFMIMLPAVEPQRHKGNEGEEK